MLILSKSILGLTLGFVLSIIVGLLIIPVLKKLKAGQTVSNLINKRDGFREAPTTDFFALVTSF